MELYEQAKSRVDCPIGDLKIRRKRKVGEPLNHKLALDCYQLCMFILGGPVEDMLSLISNHSSNKLADHSVLFTLTSTPSSVPIVNEADNLRGDALAGLKTELLLIKSELEEQRSEHDVEIHKLKNQVNSLKTFETKCDTLEAKLNTLEKNHSKLYEFTNKKLKDLAEVNKELCKSLKTAQESVDSLNKSINSTNAEIRADLIIVETDILTRKREIESLSMKVKQLTNDSKTTHLNLADINRQITSLKEPNDDALCSLKGEFKILRQAIKQLNDDSEQIKSSCSSMNSSITNLRSRLSASEQKSVTAKRNISNNRCDIDLSVQTKNTRTVRADVHAAENAYPSSATSISVEKSMETEITHNDKCNDSTARSITNEQFTEVAARASGRSYAEAARRNETDFNAPVRSKFVRAKNDETNYNIHTEKKQIPVVCRTFYSNNNKDNNQSQAHNDTAAYYLGNLNINVTRETTIRHLTYHDIYPSYLKIIPNKKSNMLGAKLHVKASDEWAITENGFWPSGVYARRWIDRGRSDQSWKF